MTVVTLPVLLIYNVVAAPPAEIAMIEEIRVELPVSPSAIALGSSVGSGAIDLTLDHHHQSVDLRDKIENISD